MSDTGAEDYGALVVRRAELTLASGDATTARELLEQVLPQLADPRGAQQLYADVLRALGDDAARAAVLRGLSEEAEDAGRRARLLTETARAYLAAGQAEQAAEVARMATELAPLESEARVVFADAAWERQAWDDVIAAYEALVPSTHTDARAGYALRLGTALERTGQLEAAIGAYETAVDGAQGTSADLQAAWRRLSACVQQTGDVERTVRVLLAYARDTRTGASDAVRAEQYHRAGELAGGLRGEADAAEAHHEAALRIDPTYMPALDALEGIYRRRGDHARVATVLGRKVRAAGNHPDRQKALLGRLARLHIEKLDRHDAAEEAYKRALELDPRFAPALRFVADAARKRGQLEVALGLYERLATSDEGQGAEGGAWERLEALLMAGTLALGRGELDRAAEHLEAAVAVDSSAVQALAALSRVYESQGRFPELAEVLRRQAKMTGGADRQALGRRRAEVLLEHVADPVAAAHAARESLADAPGNAALLELLLRAVRAAGDGDSEEQVLGELRALQGPEALAAMETLEAAREHLERDDVPGAEDLLASVSRQDATPPLLLLRAELAEERDAWSEVAADLSALQERAVAEDDTALERLVARRLATVLFERLRDYKEAARYYERALAIDPDDLAAAEGLKHLMRLTGDAAGEERMQKVVRDIEERTGYFNREVAVDAGWGADERTEPVHQHSAEDVDAPPELLEAASENTREKAERRRQLRQEGDWEALLSVLLEDATASPADSAELFAEAARVAGVAMGDPEQAFQLLTAAVDACADPRRQAELLAERADMGASLGRDEQALADLEQAATLGEPGPLGELARARVAGRQGKHDEALIHVGRARAGALEPWHLVDAHTLEGAAHDARGDTREAVASYQRAAAIAPQDTRPLEALLRIAEDTRDHELMVQLVGMQIDQASDDGERARLWYRRAMINRDHLEDDAETRRCLRQAVARDPGNLEANEALQTIAEARGEWHLLADLMEQRIACLDDSEDRAALHARLAHVAAEHLGQAQKALQHYEKAVALAPEDYESMTALHRLTHRSERRRDPDEVRAELLAQLEAITDWQAELEIHRQLLDNAIWAADDAEIEDRAQEVLARDLSDLPAFLELRRLAMEHEDWGMLTELCHGRADVLEDPRAKAPLYFEVGRLAVAQLGDPERAQLMFEQALKLDPLMVAALDALADIAYTNHDWHRAAELYQRLEPEDSKLEPGELWFRRGELAEAMGHSEDAQAAYRKVLVIDADHVASLEGVSRLALYAGDLVEARTALEQVLRLLPMQEVERMTAIRQQVAELCQQSGDLDGARQYYERVLTEDPRRIGTLDALVNVYTAQGQWELAAGALERLSTQVSADDKRAALLYQVGEMHLTHLGRPDEAADYYLKAADLDPGHVATLRRLVDHYWRETDDAGLCELAGDLARHDALASPETGAENWARIGVAAAARGDDALAGQMARALGESGAGALAAALVAYSKRDGVGVTTVPAMARLVTTATGPTLGAVTDVLRVRGQNDPDAQALAAALAGDGPVAPAG